MPAQGIDMNNLSDRELLLLVSQKVNKIEKEIERNMAENLVLQLKMREIETKVKFYAAGISIVIGLITSIATTIIIQLISS